MLARCFGVLAPVVGMFAAREGCLTRTAQLLGTVSHVLTPSG